MPQGGGFMAEQTQVYYDSTGKGVTMLRPAGSPPPPGYYRSRNEALSAGQQAGMASLDSDYEKGRARGVEEFYNDPDMQMLRQRQEDLSKGYSGAELGAKREEARSAIQGQRQGYQRQLAGRVGRAGIGGARAAAMQAGADKGFMQAGAEAERKMLLDNAALTRQGVGSLQDFIFRQKYGTLGSAIGEQQAGLAERGKYAAAQANSGGGGGMSWICTKIHKKVKAWSFGEMKSLKKLAKFAADFDPAMADLYFKEAGKMVDKMESDKFDFSNLISPIKDIIDLVKQDRMEEAYYNYKTMTQGLAVIYWR